MTRRHAPRPVWVSRDECNGLRTAYELWPIRPRQAGDQFVHSNVVSLAVYCAGTFERVTGLHLAPGECVKVMITMKRVRP